MNNSRNPEKLIKKNLTRAIEGGKINEIYPNLIDFINNIDIDSQVEFFKNSFPTLNEEDVEGFLTQTVKIINKKNKVSEDEIAKTLMDLILDKWSSDKMLSEAPKRFEEKNNPRDVLRNIINNKDLFYDLISGYKKKSAIKEVIGWFAGYIEVANEKDLKKLIVYKKDESVDRRKTLKRILKEINKVSATKSDPFKADYSKRDKLEMDMIRVYLKLSKNKEVDAYSLILSLPQNDITKNKYTESQLIESKELVTNVAKGIIGRNHSELRERLSKLEKYSYIQEESGNVDVLLSIPTERRILGMSITSDPTTRIEQNQFFRHAFKTMIMSMELNKRYPDGFNRMQARHYLKNLELEIKIKGGSDSYKKSIDEMNFEELVRYYFQEKKQKRKDFKKISNSEMDSIITDINKYSRFIFYGESFSYARGDLKEELAGMVMLSYVNNLKNLGNISLDSYESAFNFLSKCVSAKFNDCGNDKNYIQHGLGLSVDFLINPVNENDVKKYSEGQCYKDGREIIYDSVKSFLNIANEKFENTENLDDFFDKLSSFLRDNNVKEEKIKSLTRDLINGKITSNLEAKTSRFKKGDSETSQELENLKLVADFLSFKIMKRMTVENTMAQKNKERVVGMAVRRD